MKNDRRPELFSAALITYAAAFTALFLRMCARRKTKVRLTWDDYLAAVAFSIATGFTFLVLFKTRWGLGRRVQYVHLPLDVIEHHYYKELFTDMWLYTFSVGLSKLVILGLYWRMFRHSAIRQPIRILFVLSVFWIITRVSLILTFCHPVRKFWDPTVPGDCPLGPMSSLFAAAIPHLILEVAILLCPLIEIAKLHMDLSKKIAVAFMFTSGFLVCGSALGTILSTVKVDKIVAENADITWDGVDAHIWAVCDVNLASFSTSLPLLRPIFHSLHQIVTGRSRTATARSDPRDQRRSAFIHGSKIPNKGKGGRSDDTESMVMVMLQEDVAEATKSPNEAYVVSPASPHDWDRVSRRDSDCMKSDRTTEYQKA